jgi:hypothetical protein
VGALREGPDSMLRGGAVSHSLHATPPLLVTIRPDAGGGAGYAAGNTPPMTAQ